MSTALLALTPIFAGIGGFGVPLLLTYKVFKIGQLLNPTEKFRVDKKVWIIAGISTGLATAIMAPALYYTGMKTTSSLIFGLLSSTAIAAMVSLGAAFILYKPEEDAKKRLEEYVKKNKQGKMAKAAADGLGAGAAIAKHGWWAALAIAGITGVSYAFNFMGGNEEEPPKENDEKKEEKSQ